MRYFKDDKFGTVLEPESFVELISLTTGQKGAKNNVWYWRGQSNIEWSIHSSAYRRIIKTSPNIKDFDSYIENYELDLLEQATHKGYRYQNGRELYDFELLGKLQLHGAATRFVDFSRNILVALWFCVNSLKSKKGLLLGIHTHFLLGHENVMKKESYNDIIKHMHSDDIYTWEPPTVSMRTAAQHSQFLYSKVSDSMKGSLMLPNQEKYILPIAISPKLKKESKIILESTFNIWTLSLFPDLDGFGMANNQYINRWDMDRW
jgi:hypothetical protein